MAATDNMRRAMNWLYVAAGLFGVAAALKVFVVVALAGGMMGWW